MNIGSSPGSISALVTAGWDPTANDPLQTYTHGRCKALLPIAGRPMIAYVIDALTNSQAINHILIVGLDPQASITFKSTVEHLPGKGDMLSNIEAGLMHILHTRPETHAVLISSSDIPLITASMIDAFIHTCQSTDHDLYYSIIERTVMEARFPQSQRSYIHFKEGNFAAGDIAFFRTNTSVQHRDLLTRLTHARKSIIKQALLLGPRVLINLLLGRLTLTAAEQSIYTHLNIRTRAVPSPYPEVGMDVDTPYQLQIVQGALSNRPNQSGK